MSAGESLSRHAGLGLPAGNTAKASYLALPFGAITAQPCTVCRHRLEELSVTKDRRCEFAKEKESEREKEKEKNQEKAAVAPRLFNNSARVSERRRDATHGPAAKQ